MEPTNTGEDSGQSEVKTVLRSNLLVVCDPLCRVTSVSKILAAVLFIIMPFLGVWVGYNYAKTTRVIENNVQDVHMDIVTAGTSSETKSFTPIQLRYTPLNGEVENFYKNNEYFEITYKGQFVIDGVTPTEEKVASILNNPFLILLATTTDSMIFTTLCFNPACGVSGLYKLNIAEKTISTMQHSEYYSPGWKTGAALSPDRTKLAVTKGFDFGVVDLIDDSYSSMGTLNYRENKTFLICEIGCYSEIKWIDNTAINATVFEFENCDKDNVCSSPSLEATRDYYGMYEIASSTVEFKI